MSDPYVVVVFWAPSIGGVLGSGSPQPGLGHGWLPNSDYEEEEHTHTS